SILPPRPRYALSLHDALPILLDIRMPLMTGMGLLNELKDKPLTIFVTAYEEYAVKGYELDVIDYLMKPVSFERFRKAIDKAVERSEEHTSELQSRENLVCRLL